MARKREGIVFESAERLQSIVESARSDQHRSRALMLLTFKQNPTMTFDAAAERLQYDARTLRRWWSKYRGGGLGRILAGEERAAPANSVTFNYPGISSGASATHNVSLRFLKFLNALPRTFDTREWVTAFQACLESVLDGVDRIAVGVDVASDLRHPGRDRVGVLVTRHHRKGSPEGEAPVTARAVMQKPGDAFVQQLADSGLPLREYQKPYPIDYYADGEYVGTIVLLRNTAQLPIPQSTLAFLRELEPFIVFLFTDCIARRMHDDAQLRVFPEVLRAVATRIGLAPRQLEVFTLQMIGTARDRIAEKLGIAVKTVDNHIQRIHEKAGTGNYSELLARFLTPLRDD